MVTRTEERVISAVIRQDFEKTERLYKIRLGLYLTTYCIPLLVEILYNPDGNMLLWLCLAWTCLFAFQDAVKFKHIGRRYFESKWHLANLFQIINFLNLLVLRNQVGKSENLHALSKISEVCLVTLCLAKLINFL